MSRGMPSLTALLGLLAVAGYQNRHKIAEVLGGLRFRDVETLLAAARGERDPSATFRKRLERALARFREQWRARHGED